MRTARELCSYHAIRLSPEGQRLLTAEQSPRQYFDRLLAASCYADARRVLAHALPRRRALWWAYACARQVYAGQVPAEVEAALEAVHRAIAEPSDDHRHAVNVLGQETLEPHPMIVCLAMACFCGGGGVSLPGLPFVGPKPFVPPRLVEVVVYLAAVHRDPLHYLERLRSYLEQGLALAGGPDPWLATTAEALQPTDPLECALLTGEE
jgi:hypothetical protein